jgi:hypothetical protein
MEGYGAALNMLKITQPDLHQVRYHRERIWSELIPLLDVVLVSTSNAATRSWCHATAITIADYSTNLLKAKLWRNIGLKFRLTSLTAVMDANERLTVKIYLLPQYTR